MNFNIDVVNGIVYLAVLQEQKMNLVAYTKETRYVNQLVNYIQLSKHLVNSRK